MASSKSSGISRFRTVALLVLAALLAAIPPNAYAGEVKVAAAADLTFAFKDVAADFQKHTGNSVTISYGSSGNFFAQIQNGAPFDLFFSADVGYAKKLEAAGLTVPGTIYTYATGKLVIWAPNTSKLDLSHGLTTLLDPSIRKIAIANPEHAPYGAAAVAAMRHVGIYDQVKSKLVLGENISQTAQFVESGNADIGLLALSLALAPAMKNEGRFVEVEAVDYPTIIQAGVILKSAKDQELAKQFMRFLKAPATVALMEQYGFSIPNASGSESGTASIPDTN